MDWMREMMALTSTARIGGRRLKAYDTATETGSEAKKVPLVAEAVTV